MQYIDIEVDPEYMTDYSDEIIEQFQAMNLDQEIVEWYVDEYADEKCNDNFMHNLIDTRVIELVRNKEYPSKEACMDAEFESIINHLVTLHSGIILAHCLNKLQQEDMPDVFAEAMIQEIEQMYKHKLEEDELSRMLDVEEKF